MLCFSLGLLALSCKDKAKRPKVKAKQKVLKNDEIARDEKGLVFFLHFTQIEEEV